MDKELSLIGSKEIILIIANQICAKLFVGLAKQFTTVAGNAAWILYAASFALQFLLLFITIKAYAPYKSKDLLEICEHTFGKTGKFVIGIFLATYFFLSFMFLSRMYIEAIKITLFHVTSVWFVLSFFVIAITAAACFGIRAISAMHVIFVPIVLIMIVLNCVFSVGNIEATNILPIFGTGVTNMVESIPQTISSFAEVVLLFLFLPKREDGKFHKKAAYWAIGLSGGVTLLFVMTYVLSVPFPASKEYALPMYQLSRMANFGRFFSRAEDIFELFWAICIFLSLSVKIWMCTYIIKRIFNLPQNKPLVAIMTIAGLSSGFLIVSLSSAIAIYQGVLIKFLWASISILPLVIAICARIKDKWKGDEKLEKI